MPVMLRPLVPFEDEKPSPASQIVQEDRDDDNVDIINKNTIEVIVLFILLLE